MTSNMVKYGLYQNFKMCLGMQNVGSEGGGFFRDLRNYFILNLRIIVKNLSW